MDKRLRALLDRGVTSAASRWIASKLFSHAVPFNQPHGIAIVDLTNTSVKTKLPYRRSNWNHIKGLHACGLATLAEFTTGVALLRQLESENYRLIMRSLALEFVYQGKSDAYCEYDVSSEWVDRTVVQPLTTHDAVTVETRPEVHDTDGNLLCTAKISWQIKPWERVGT